MKKLKKVKKIYISGSTCVNPLISWPWAYDWDNPIKKRKKTWRSIPWKIKCWMMKLIYIYIYIYKDLKKYQNQFILTFKTHDCNDEIKT